MGLFSLKFSHFHHPSTILAPVVIHVSLLPPFPLTNITNMTYNFFIMFCVEFVCSDLDQNNCSKLIEVPEVTGVALAGSPVLELLGGCLNSCVFLLLGLIDNKSH